MGTLKNELLSVYRRLTHVNDERDRLRLSRDADRKKLKEAEDEVDMQVNLRGEERKMWDKVLNDLVEENAKLKVQVFEFNRAYDVVLDLVGYVIEEDATLDDMFASIQAHEMDGFSPPPISAPFEPKPQPADRDTPGFCISCGGEKDGLYVCEECWELCLDHNNELFDQLADAWDAGLRDFPHPSRNAKELYR